MYGCSVNYTRYQHSYIIASRHVFYVKEILHDNVVNENKCVCVYRNLFHMKLINADLSICGSKRRPCT